MNTNSKLGLAEGAVFLLKLTQEGLTDKDLQMANLAMQTNGTIIARDLVSAIKDVANGTKPRASSQLNLVNPEEKVAA